MLPELKQLIVKNNDSLRHALEVINDNGQGICFVLDGEKTVGVVTDGDIRRALINNLNLDCLVSEVMRKNYKWLSYDASSVDIQSTLSKNYKVIPLLDENKKLVDFACANQFHQIPIAKPDLEGNELAYVTECIKTGWISSQGKYVKQFEEDFASYIRSTNTIAVSNGTVALHLALVALGIKSGDEVLVPDLTFAAPVNAILYIGAIPVLIDVDPDTFCIDPLSAAAAVTSKTKAIIPVHLYGHPANMDAISDLALKHKLLVIEDCAEAVGTHYSGKHVGSFGDAAIFSFFGNKTITTGEGGMLILKDPDIYKCAVMLRDHGMDPERRYWHKEVGFNYRLTNVQAAIGVAQLERVKEFVELKRNIARLYTKNLSGLNSIKLPGEYGDVVNSYWLYTITLINELTINERDELLRKLMLNGIEARNVFIPIHEMPPYTKYIKNNECFPVASKVSQTSISLPSSVSLKESEIEAVCDIIRGIVSSS